MLENTTRSARTDTATTAKHCKLDKLRLELLLSKADSRSRCAGRVLSFMIVYDRNTGLIDAGEQNSISAY